MILRDFRLPAPQLSHHGSPVEVDELIKKGTSLRRGRMEPGRQQGTLKAGLGVTFRGPPARV